MMLSSTLGVIRICSLVFVNSSAQDASIFKISVAIFKRRSWGFQNTPNLWDLEHFKPSYGHLKKIEVSKNNFDWQFCSKYKQILNYLKTSLFSNCHNLAQNHSNFASWGCFGILRPSSTWWPQIYLNLMQPGLRNGQKRECHSYRRQLYVYHSFHHLPPTTQPTPAFQCPMKMATSIMRPHIGLFTNTVCKWTAFSSCLLIAFALPPPHTWRRHRRTWPWPRTSCLQIFFWGILQTCCSHPGNHPNGHSKASRKV